MVSRGILKDSDKMVKPKQTEKELEAEKQISQNMQNALLLVKQQKTKIDIAYYAVMQENETETLYKILKATYLLLLPEQKEAFRMIYAYELVKNPNSFFSKKQENLKEFFEIK